MASLLGGMTPKTETMAPSAAAVRSSLKKKLTFEERQARIEQMLLKADFDDDKLSPNEAKLTKWSDEAIELN